MKYVVELILKRPATTGGEDKKVFCKIGILEIVGLRSGKLINLLGQKELGS